MHVLTEDQETRDTPGVTPIRGLATNDGRLLFFGVQMGQGGKPLAVGSSGLQPQPARGTIQAAISR